MVVFSYGESEGYKTELAQHFAFSAVFSPPIVIKDKDFTTPDYGAFRSNLCAALLDTLYIYLIRKRVKFTIL